MNVIGSATGLVSNAAGAVGRVGGGVDQAQAVNGVNQGSSTSSALAEEAKLNDKNTADLTHAMAQSQRTDTANSTRQQAELNRQTVANNGLQKMGGLSPVTY